MEANCWGYKDPTGLCVISFLPLSSEAFLNWVCPQMGCCNKWTSSFSQCSSCIYEFALLYIETVSLGKKKNTHTQTNKKKNHRSALKKRGGQEILNKISRQMS